MNGYRQWLRRLIIAMLGLTVFGFATGMGAVSVIVFQVFFGDDSVLQRETFLAKMNEETIILTLDEQTRIGSFFDSIHRRYIPIDEVPAHLINAFIASEDKNFYSHIGVDPTAIFSAFVDGVKAGGRFRRGGSTITQQTVKNILDKREHSFKRKFREWVRALQLERLYEKRQVMEFYLNQFHVAHNGNGVGIAAKYYFDKDVRDLNLTEAAFIAGSVKAPSKYNPFIQNTPERRVRAWKFADQRKNYVLRRMYEQGWINKEELKEAWESRVPFKKGKFQSKEVALVSLIRGQMNKKEILDAVNLDNISQLNTAGLRIYTTLDIEMQKSAQLAMRRNLSRLDTILQGFKKEPEDSFVYKRDLDVNEFYPAKIIEIVKDPKGKPSLKVDYGLPKGTVPYDSLKRFASKIDATKGIGIDKQIDKLLKSIKPGDIIFTEIREYDSVEHVALAEIERRPRVSGGLIAIDKGEVRAVVSGFDPKGYNRAIFATRQPGSVFKAVVYYAAQQLGWSMLDQLDNERRVFPYQGQFYYPQPDHDSPFSSVSMIWAGAKSENLGSIYLTAHLLDKLSFEEFKTLLGSMGLMPEEDEKPRDYHYRVARKLGVSLDTGGVKEHELVGAISDISPDLIFRREEKLLNKLKKMWWGRGYAAELQALYQLDVENFSDREQLARIDLIKNNFARHKKIMAMVTEDWNTVSSRVAELGADRVFTDPILSEILERFRVLPGRSGKPQLGYFRVLDDEKPPENLERQVDLAPSVGRTVNPLDVQAIWGEASFFSANADLSLTDVRLEGYLPIGYLTMIEKNLNERVDGILQIEEPYDLQRYFHHHDFRISMGLNYLVDVTKEMGVFSKIEPVLSFALGTNVVSVAEVAKVYQTFIEGKTYKFYKEGPPNQLNFIRRVEDRFGNVLYEPELIVHQLTDPNVSTQMRQILRKVVTHGTGRLARGELYVELDESVAADPRTKKGMRIRIPAFGKTGTTNDYRTASFAGFVPYPVVKNEPLDPSYSHVLAAYVGYDLNDIMQTGQYKVSGAVGALPAWSALAKSIFEIKEYKNYLDALDINILSTKEWPISYGKSTDSVKIDLARGLILRGANSSDFEQFPTTDMFRQGELRINEFALDASVQSVVRLPASVSNAADRGLNRVSFFKPNISEEERKAKAEEKAGDKPAQERPATKTGSWSELKTKQYQKKRTAAARVPIKTANKEKQKPVVQNNRSQGGSMEDNQPTNGEVSVNGEGSVGGNPEIKSVVPEMNSEVPRDESSDSGDPGYVEEELW